MRANIAEKEEETEEGREGEDRRRQRRREIKKAPLSATKNNIA
jgi:hypothetical protein